MKKKMKTNTPKKEEICEDWCFVCKDGGLLLVCDYKQCLKAYHPGCVGKDESFLENGERWSCSCHSCFICNRASNFYCHCCPKAVCQRCINDAEFVLVKGKKGFCYYCLKIALLVEENKDVDSDGGKVDFEDKETYEGLFKEYWEIIKQKEGLTVENLQSANARLEKGMNYKSCSDSDEHDESEEDQLMSDHDNMDYIEEHKPKRKRKRAMGQTSLIKRKLKSNKKEFIGWGSKSLVQFLSSIGKDTREILSQRDVTSIINGYIKENNLFDPQKKKKVICDERLQSVLGRKTVNKNRIYDLLEAHFAENLDQSEEDEFGYNSGDKDGDTLVASKKQRKSSKDKTSQKKEVVFDIPQSCFASIVSENIKLVYLKRSLVQGLLQQPETFETKVTGSFVRVKSDPNDLFQNNSYQLVQVKGIKASSAGENNTEIFLQVSNRPKDICISVLSDDNFSEDECEDLRRRVEGGLLKKLTVDELEQKARSLHEDITKHWIARELDLLQNLIDRANEKGWRRELYEYMERRQLLQTSAEQSRLLQKVPMVISDAAELEPISEDVKDDAEGDEDLPKSILVGCSEIPGDNWEGNGTSSVEEEKKHFGQVSVREGKQHHTETTAQEEPPQNSRILTPEVQNNVLLQREPSRQSISEKKQNCSEKASILQELPQQYNILAPEDQFTDIPMSKQHQYSSCLALTKESQPNYVKQGMAKSQGALTIQLIELSSDDDGDDNSSTASGKNKLEGPESALWHCLGPNGERKGPHSLSFLKRWGETTPFAFKFKVWKTNQSEENAIPLTDAVNLVSPGK